MKLTYYQDKSGKFRWNLKAANGRIVADSGQGYVTKRGCQDGWALTANVFLPTVVYDWT